MGGESLVLASGSALGLREWLKLPWFFPESFAPAEVRERNDLLEVVGRHEVYRFPKLFAERLVTSDTEEFRNLWKAACRDLLNSVLWAPAVAVGLRAFRWNEGEPEWLSDAPTKDVADERPPKNANGFAIVSLRLEEYLRLDAVVARGEQLSWKVPGEIATILEILHRRSGEGIRRHWEDHRRRVRARLRAQYIELPHQIFQRVSGELPPLEHLAVTDVLSYLGRNYSKHEELFLSRGRAGHVVHAHGDLRAENIYLHRVRNRGRRLAIVNRRAVVSAERFADRIEDVATLALDLEARRETTVARQFTERYFERGEELFDPLVWDMTVARLALIRGLDLTGKNDRASLLLRSHFLSSAFCTAHGIQLPFLLGIEEGERPCGTPYEIAVALQQFLPRGVIEVVPDENKLEPIELERRFRKVRHRLNAGEAVVVIFPRRSEVMLQLFREAAGDSESAIVLASPPDEFESSLCEICGLRVFLSDPVLNPIESAYFLIRNLATRSIGISSHR